MSDMIPLLLTLAAAGYLAWALRRRPGPRSVALGWLLIACPYLAFRLLRGHVHALAHTPAGPAHQPEDEGGFAKIYRPFMRGLMERRGRRLGFYGGVVALLFLSMGLIAIKAVQVKMLPFDNKSEFQVVLDFPEGTTLETSAGAAANRSGSRIRPPRPPLRSTPGGHPPTAGAGCRAARP